MKRAISLLLALTLFLLLATAALASSPAYGSEVWLQETRLQDGVVLSDNIFWSESYDKPRHEYYITYSPGGAAFEPETVPEPDAPAPDGDIPGWLLNGRSEYAASVVSYSFGSGVRPVAAFGSSVCDRLTAAAAAQYYEGLGYRVVGAINGDFYDVSTGFPLGLLVSDGQLLSGASDYYAVGFRQDGSVVMGEPKLSITAQSDAGMSINIWSINKPRVEKGGVTLLTHYFRNDHRTGTATAGVNVLARITGGRASIGEQLTVQVEQVLEESAAYTLEENQVLLSAAANGYADALAFLRSLTPGQTVTVSFTTPDPSWNDVTEAIGALYLLVSGGVVQSGFEVSAAPRTAVGVKANGDLVLYTIDGRQSSHSMGASLGVLAERMKELGCVTALCLDGGGSTTIVAATPDQTAARTLNSPSDKNLRKVTNHIVLLAPGGATGQARSLQLSASAPAVLAGHPVELNAVLSDSHYYPMSGDIQMVPSGGEIQGNTLHTPQTGGLVTVNAFSGSLTAQTDILVLDEPGGVAITRSGSNISSLTVTPGETVQLGLAGSYNHRNIEIFPTDYTWQLDPSLGTIDENGLLTAALSDGKGTITAVRGNSTVSIPLTVDGKSPFVDTEGHWAEKYLTDLYYQGILAGVTTDGQLYAYPDKGVTRAEFSVLLGRFIGLHPDDYASVETPFPDLGPVESWAGNAIRAMYTMGIVNGAEINGKVVFDPQGTLTRAQAVAMLGRLLASEEDEGVPPPLDWDEAEPLPDSPEEPVTADLSQFKDADRIPSYALEHFQLLVGMGAIDGSDGLLDPNGTMTRAVICKALSVLTDAF